MISPLADDNSIVARYSHYRLSEWEEGRNSDGKRLEARMGRRKPVEGRKKGEKRREKLRREENQEEKIADSMA
ncbi:hypothetical protein NAH03_22925, partial [Stenotrophomonas maltophilia]|uniref:hypothetical protein n=1 Tax=Stenotrophomonas maltophilia TaxID=40324 RepID=UPI0022535EDE|nr:hypothetical protein [Stenotrophomonas maltophilia]